MTVKTNKSKFLKNIPVESISADLIFILINIFLISYISDFVKINFKLCVFLTLPFQVLAILAATIGYFNKESKESSVGFFQDESSANSIFHKKVWTSAPAYTKFYQKIWASVPFNKYCEPLTFSMHLWWASISFLLLFGFFWMGPLVSAFFLQQNLNININDGHFVIMTIINFILLFSALSFSYNLSVNKNVGEKKWMKYASALTVMLFLTFLNSVMKESLIIIKPEQTENEHLVSVLLTISMFLPVRLVLFLKPPFSFIEVLTFGMAYALFIKELLVI